MTQYNTLNVKLPNSQLYKLKSGIKKHCTKVDLKLSSNFVGHSNDGNNFPHKLLLTNTQGLKLRKAFLNDSSANIELSKTQLRNKGQSEGYLQSLLGPLLLANGLSTFPLIGNVLTPLAKSISIPLGLTAAVPAADAAIHKNML